MTRDTAARLLAAVGTGASFALSVPDTSAWWLGFVTWIPLLWAVDGQTVRRAAMYGVVAGTSLTLLGFAWMVPLLGRFGGIPTVPALGIHLVFSLAQGTQLALFAGLFAWLRRSGLWTAVPAWVVAEAFAPHLFPTYASLPWYDTPVLLQLAELGGVTLVGAAQMLLSVAIYAAIRHRSPRWAVTFGVGLGALVGFGMWRMQAADSLAAASPTARFGVVQGNFGMDEWSGKDTRGAVLGRIQAETAEVDAQGVDVIVWGENVYPWLKRLRHEGGSDGLPWIPERIRVGFEAPLVFGAVTSEPALDGPVSVVNPYGWNSALVLGAEDTFGDRYDKNHPLWFGERAPLFVDPAWYLANVPGSSHINAGTEPSVLRVGEWRLGPLICYEDILPRFVRAVADQGVHVLVNLTDDGWFGRSAEQGEHLGLAVPRAIETRRAMVRAVNAGPSVYIDPAGRVDHRTEVTDADVEGPAEPVHFVVDVPMIDPSARTLYMRFGEWVPALAAALAVLAIRRR